VTDFDPILLAEHCRREGLHLSVNQPTAPVDASGRARVAAFDLESIVSAWLVGEAERFRSALVRTAEWLAAADADLGDDDREGLFGVVRRRRALATARWLLGTDGRAAAAGAARAGAARLAQHPRLSPHEFAEHLCDWLRAGDPSGAIAAAAAHPPDPEDIEAVTALRLATAAGNAEANRDLLAPAGDMLAQRLENWLYNGAFIRIANWMQLIFGDTDIASDPKGALLTVYAYLPGVRVPPALAARGWPPDANSAIVTLTNASLDRVDRLAAVLGLRRDVDAVRQDSAAPAFASWTAPSLDDREIDWHDADGQRWLEIRGRDAGVLADVLAAALRGQVADDPAQALAKVLTIRRGDGLSAVGALRLRTLRAAVAAAVPENMLAVAALVSAGLSDPDWRVRMAAVIAVGKLRLAALADKAMAAKVPPAGTSGLHSEDRRVLLALRQAAHDCAKGLAPSTGPGEGMPEDIAAKRRAYQQRLHALLGGEAGDEGDTAALIIMALMAAGQARPDRYPPRWRGWLDREED
jgi:hypothetical protein